MEKLIPSPAGALQFEVLFVKNCFLWSNRQKLFQDLDN